MRDAVRTPDGRIVVMDGGDLEIRVFGPDGSHQGSFGRAGDGPREFEAFPKMTLRPPDTVVVWDPGHGRLSWFDLTGALLRQWSFPTVLVDLSIVRGTPWRLRPDGSMLSARPLSLTRGDGLVDRGRQIGLIDDAGETSHDFGVFPGSQSYDHPMGLGFPTWFGSRVQEALGPPPLRVALSSPENWEIRFFSSDGQLVRILRAPIPRVEVTPEIRTARRAYTEDIALRSRLTHGEAAKIENQMPVPDSLPAIAKMMWDQEDNLWVGRRVARPNTSEYYDVFDQSGHWITTVHLPSMARELGIVREIGDDYILTEWIDDLDVSYLRLYRLEKSNG